MLTIRALMWKIECSVPGAEDWYVFHKTCSELEPDPALLQATRKLLRSRPSFGASCPDSSPGLRITA